MMPHLLNKLSNSLFGRLFVVLLVTILVVQVLTGALLLLLPPPVPNIFLVSEVASALRNADPNHAVGQFSTEIADAPPAEIPGTELAQPKALLTRLLGQPPSEVVLGVRTIPLLPQTHIATLVRNRLIVRNAGSDGILIGDFLAARRLGNGRWIVIQPRYARLPTDWLQALALWLVLIACLVAVPAWSQARRLAKPFQRFAESAARIGRDPSVAPLAIGGPSVVVMAVTALNDMQQQLQRYVVGRTQMVGAIAHDLRTPLTRIRFAIENIEPAMRIKIAADIAEMEAMIDTTLAFVRDGSVKGSREPLDLGSLIDVIISEMSDIGGRVAWAHEPAKLAVVGDPIALRRLFVNLIGNAIKFGNSAQVMLDGRDGSAVTTIDDDGPGIPDDELESVFDPFYRAEPSRSHETGGIGLGLAVVRSVARAHGGEVALSNTGQGLRATVTLPVMEQY